MSAVAAAALGCTIGDVVSNPDFEMRDGDASVLPVGTELHSFGDARPTLRGHLGRAAGRGHGGAGHGFGRRPESVRRLVAAVLAAPVLAGPPDDLGSAVFVRFLLADGTWVQRPWKRQGGVLAQRIEAPAELEQLFPPD